MLGQVVGALVAGVLVATVSAFAGAGVAAFWAYVRGAGAREGSTVTGVVGSVRGVGRFIGCWADRAWVGLEPLI